MALLVSSRPLGNTEVFFKQLADLGAPLEREHWAVHLALSLRVAGAVNLAPHLQTTWQIVRQQYPVIGSIVSSSKESAGQGQTESPAKETLGIPAFDAVVWNRDTFFVHDKEADADSLFSGLRPSSTATCHWLPQSSQLVIRSSHWRLDGIGVAKLGHVFLSTLVELLGTAADGLPVAASKHLSPIQQPPPSIEQIAAVWRKPRMVETTASSQDESSAYSLHLEAGADALVGDFLRGMPSIATRPDSAAAQPGASARVEIRLNASTTARITEARGQKKLSFTGAVHATIVRVTARYAQHPLAKSYAAFFPVDLRRSVLAAGAASEDDSMIGLYFSGLPVCVEGVVSAQDGKSPAAKDFDEVAREMTAVYWRDLTAFWKAPDEQQISLMELAGPYFQRSTVLFNSPVPEGLPPIQTPYLSGLGKIETYLRRGYQSLSDPLAPIVEVSGVWIATEQINRCVQFHVWSWRDELHLGAAFNQSFYEKAFVAELLGQIVEELLKGLEIS